MKSHRAIWVAAALLFACGIALSLRFREGPGRIPQPGNNPSQADPVESRPDPRTTATPQRAAAPATARISPTNSAPVETTNWLQRLLSDEGPRVSREQIESWLASRGTNAESLLAARQAGGGREYLLQALTNFPNDPRVLFAACALDDTAEARRERLDRFKAVAPDNALPDYLSARDHFKNSDPAAAVRDLVSATGKNRFQDYSLDAVQNTEELLLAAGKSPAEAKAIATSSALLPHLSQLKGVAQEMAALQRQYIASGDNASAENLAQYGLQLARHLGTGESSRTIIDELVGIAIERIVLNPLDASRNYDFLNNGTVADRIARLDDQRQAVRENTQFVNAWFRTADDAEILNYFERNKIYGEGAAIAWLRRQKALSPP